MIDRNQEKALEILGKIQESMVQDLIEDLVINEESYTGGGDEFDNSYNFNLQDLEDKYAMKLWNIQRFINEVYKLNSGAELPEHKVDIVFADKTDLGRMINARLEQLRPIQLLDVKIQRESDAYMAMIIYSPFDPCARLQDS